MKEPALILALLISLPVYSVEAQISSTGPAKASSSSGGSTSALSTPVISTPTKTPPAPTGKPDIETLRRQAEGLQTLKGKGAERLKDVVPNSESGETTAPNLPSSQLKEFGVGDINLQLGPRTKVITQTVPNPEAGKIDNPASSEDFELLKTLDEDTVEMLLKQQIPEVEDPSAFNEPEEEANEFQALPGKGRLDGEEDPETRVGSRIGSQGGYNEGATSKVGGQRETVMEDTDIPGAKEFTVEVNGEKYQVVIIGVTDYQSLTGDYSKEPGSIITDNSKDGLFGIVVVSDDPSYEETTEAAQRGAEYLDGVMGKEDKGEIPGLVPEPLVAEPSWYEEGGSWFGDAIAWIIGLFSSDDDPNTDGEVIVGEDEPASDNSDALVIVGEDEPAGDNSDGEVILDDDEEADEEEGDDEEEAEEEAEEDGDGSRDSFTGNDNDDGGGKDGPLNGERFSGGQQGGIGGRSGNDGDTIRMGESEGKGGPLVAAPETGNPTIRFDPEVVESGEINMVRLKALLEDGAIDFGEDGDPRDQPKPVAGGEGSVPINGGNPSINVKDSIGLEVEREDLEVEVDVEAELAETVENAENLESN